MKKYMSIKRLLNDALDTSSTTYSRILNAFDGVEIAPIWERMWCTVVSKYITDYNAEVNNWDMIPADLSTRGRHAMIEKAVLSIIKDSICTTKRGYRYYRLNDEPTDDVDLKEMPDVEKLYALFNA